MGEAVKPFPDEPAFEARTALGKRLAALRVEIVTSGVPLLDPSGVQRELADRRGELQEDPLP